MYKSVRIMLICIILIVLVSSFIGCNKDANDISSNDTLTMYKMDYDRVMESMINKFSSENPNIILNVVEFSDFDEYKQRLFTELMAGKGPDIVFYQDTTFNSVNKIVNSGVFLDLNSVIDDRFNETLKVNILRNAYIDNSLYYIPINYSINSFWTPDLDNNLFSDKVKLGEIDKVEDYAILEQEYENIYGGWEILPHEYMTCRGIQLVDYTNKELLLDVEEIEQLLLDYAAFYNNSAGNENFEVIGTNSVNQYLTKTAFLLNEGYGLTNEKQLYFMNSISEKYLDAELRLIPLYTDKGEIYATPRNLLSINAESENIELAVDFAHCVLDDDFIMSTDAFFNISISNYKTNDLWLELRDKYNIDFTHNIYGDVEFVEVPNHLLNTFDKINDEIVLVDMVDYEVMLTLHEQFHNYIDGTLTSNEAANSIIRKLEIYMSE